MLTCGRNLQQTYADHIALHLSYYQMDLVVDHPSFCYPCGLREDIFHLLEEGRPETEMPPPLATAAAAEAGAAIVVHLPACCALRGKRTT